MRESFRIMWPMRRIVMFNWVTADGYSKSVRLDLLEARKYESGDVLLR